MTSCTAGASPTQQEHHRCLQIQAPNGTVRNVQIGGTSGQTGLAANGTSVINVDEGASTTIDHVRIDDMDGVHACIWHAGTAMTATAVDCHDVNDGIFSWADPHYPGDCGDHFTINDNYITTGTANGHIDGYQTEGAGSGLISHSTYLMTSDNQNGTDSAIAVWNSLKSSHYIAVSDSLVAGGGFAIYAQGYIPSGENPSGGFAVTSITFTGKRFSTRLFSCIGYYGVCSRAAPRPTGGGATATPCSRPAPTWTPAT